MKMRDELKEVSWNLLKAVVKEIREVDGYFKTVHETEDERMISYPNEIASEYVRGIRVLRRKAKAQGKFLSDERLERLLDDFIMNIAFSTSTNLNNEIDKEIKKTFVVISQLPNERRLYLIPIVQISIVTKRKISIGDSEILNLTTASLEEFQKIYNLKDDFFKETTVKVSRITESNETTAFIKVIIDAGDPDKALEMALNKAERCLNVLRLYNPNATVRLRGDVYTPVRREIVSANLDKKTASGRTSSENLVPIASEIDGPTVMRMEKHGLKTINSILTKEIRLLSELEGDILTAIFWFGGAAKDKYSINKFLKYVIAMETLLLSGETNKKETISERLVYVLYRSEEDELKKKAYAEMWRLYRLRNEVIHAGRDYVEKEDVGQIEGWCRGLIFTLLGYTPRYSDILSLIEKEFTI